MTHMSSTCTINHRIHKNVNVQYEHQPQDNTQLKQCRECQQPIDKLQQHKLSPILQYCPHCNRLQPINSSSYTYYDIFQLHTYEYNIDKAQLAKQYKSLQRILHPDLYTNAPSTEQSISSDTSSLVNTAYTIMMNDYHRAVYLLELNNVVWEKTNNSLNNSTELIYVMQIREQIDECIDHKQYQQLIQLNTENQIQIDQITEILNNTLSPHNEQLKLTQEQIDSSLPYVAKLSYLIQIQQTIHAHLPST